MTKIGTAYVDVDGDFTRLNKGIDQATSGTRSKFKAIGKAAAAGLAIGAGAFIALGKAGIDAASDIDESLSKNNKLFGKYAKGVETFAATSAKAYGISKRSALEYTGVFGNLFRALGESEKAAASQSVELTKLAADMASFNNTSVEDALEAIRSGLVGETEPLRRFGVNMNDATLRAQALKMGLIDSTKDALDPHTKALAASALIATQTKNAHGDFARTSDGLANQQKILRARLDDASAALGAKFLPAALAAIKAVDGVANAVRGAVGWLREHKSIVFAVGAAVGVAAVAFGGYAAAVKIAALGQAALNLVMAANPIGLVVIAIAALVGALVYAYQESETFRKIVDGAFQAIKAAAGFVFPFIAKVVQDAWNAIKSVTSTVWGAIRDTLKAIWDGLKFAVTTYFGVYQSIVLGAWRAIRDTGAAIWGTIREALRLAWEGVKVVAAAAWDGIRAVVVSPIRAAAETVREVVRGLRDWLGERWGDIRDGVGKLKDGFVGAFDKIRDIVKDVWNWLKKVADMVKDVVDVIGKIKIPKISIPNPFGGVGGAGGGMVGPGAPGTLQGIADTSLAWGLSGGRGPNQAYRPGDDGWHGQNRARDLSGSASAMMAYARYLFKNFGPRLLELIYTPMGVGIKNGQVVNVRSFYGDRVADDHYDHVHVAMQDGGHVKRGGWALVGEQGPELARLPSGTTVYPHGTGPASPGGDTEVRVFIGERELTDIVRVEISERDRADAAKWRAGVLA